MNEGEYMGIGKRPMVDATIRSAIDTWFLYFQHDSFCGTQLHDFIVHMDMIPNAVKGGISQTMVCNRLSAWFKSGRLPMLEKISSYPHTFKWREEE